MSKGFNPILSALPTTIFELMSGLARQNEAINLGQGFPDDKGAPDLLAAAAKALLEGDNQYPPMMGIPALRQAIAAHYARFYGLKLDSEREVMVTSGATEALAAALFGFIAPGDEVVLFEPLYDAYLPLVLRAGGVPKFVSLKPPYWNLEEENLAAVFSERTKLVVFNNPHNPIGKVYTPQELALLAEFCIKYDVIAICDEVWEHVVFDGLTHLPLMNLPNMRERCVKISSAGKIFSLTGWKVGFVMAEARLMQPVAKAHQFLTFTTPPNLQKAVAYGLGKEEDFFDQMRADFQASRDYLHNGLASLGFDVFVSQGTYFLTVNLAPENEALFHFRKLGFDKDVDFCTHLVQHAKVASIPVSAFYAHNAVKNIIRLCFAKKRETLDAALLNIKAFLGK